MDRCHLERCHLDDDSDREIIIETRLAVARLEERTVDVPEFGTRLTKVETDVTWIKRIGGGFGSLMVTVTTGIIAVILKMRGLS